MFEKNLVVSYLLDFYGDVLDEHTHAVMTAYYDDDLSLSEVAALVGISRQGVRHIIKKGEEQLTFLEEKLGLAAYHKALDGAARELDEAIALLRADGDGSQSEIARKLISVRAVLLDKQ